MKVCISQPIRTSFLFLFQFVKTPQIQTSSKWPKWSPSETVRPANCHVHMILVVIGNFKQYKSKAKEISKQTNKQKTIIENKKCEYLMVKTFYSYAIVL